MILHSKRLYILLFISLPLLYLNGQVSDERRLARYLERNPQADADGDGTLTKEEYEAFRKPPAKSNKGANSGGNEQRLARYLKRNPQADADGDGILTEGEFNAFRENSGKSRRGANSGGGDGSLMAKRKAGMQVDPGWNKPKFPSHAASYKSPSEIMSIYKSGPQGQTPVRNDAMSFPEQPKGVMRIIGTGHSFMKPGYVTLGSITQALGFEQPLCLHLGAGQKGSTRYKWEMENGIFQFDRQPLPKLLAALSNAEWEAMAWGPFPDDRAEFYTCWMDFCEKYNPGMKYFLSDAWPELEQFQKAFSLKGNPKSEAFFTEERFDEVNRISTQFFSNLVGELRQTSPKVYIIPTHAAFTELAKRFVRGELPGVDGLYKVVGREENSIWRDQRGHLASDYERFEGYVFFATFYGRSPELIKKRIPFEDANDFRNPELDAIFREIAWQAVVQHPLSGVKDANHNGIGDHLE